MQSKSYASPPGFPFFGGHVLWTSLNTVNVIIILCFPFSAGLMDSARPAECREEMNAAQPAEPPCDAQRIVLVKNCVHAPTLAHVEETN
jgi:hypothetical protein